MGKRKTRRQSDETALVPGVPAAAPESAEPPEPAFRPWECATCEVVQHRAKVCEQCVKARRFERDEVIVSSSETVWELQKELWGSLHHPKERAAVTQYLQGLHRSLAYRLLLLFSGWRGEQVVEDVQENSTNQLLQLHLPGSVGDLSELGKICSFEEGREAAGEKTRAQGWRSARRLPGGDVIILVTPLLFTYTWGVKVRGTRLLSVKYNTVKLNCIVNK